MIYIDHRIVEHGNQRFADMVDVGKYTAQIISDHGTLNRRVFAYTEILSMNEIRDVMAVAIGETSPKPTYVHMLLITMLAVFPWISITNSCSLGDGRRDKGYHTNHREEARGESRESHAPK